MNATGTVAVAALLDGTLRWFGLSHDAPLQPRVALFAHADGARWVLFTPEGLFDHADRGGKDLVGVHLNRGRDQQPEWTSFSQAYRALYAPAAVRSRLAGDPGPSRARLAELGDLRARLARQPAVEFAELCVPMADGTCAALDPHAATLPRLPAQANKLRYRRAPDRPRPRHRRHRCLRQRPQCRTLRRAGRRTTARPARRSMCRSILARTPSSSGSTTSRTRCSSRRSRWTWQPPDSDAGEHGRLFVLAVGIDHFAAPSLTLNYAVADAADLRAGRPAIGGAAVLHRSMSPC